jgi:PAS domain S-box-containing protein
MKSVRPPLLVTAAIRNIGGRKNAQKQLAQMEGRHRGLLEAAPDAMVVVNQSGEIVFLNLQAEKQFGYRRDELVGQKVTNIIPEGFVERLIADDLQSADDALAQQIGTGIELIGRRKDGGEFPIELMLSPLESPEGILVTAAIRNISVRKAAEIHLAQMESRYRGLLEAAPDAIVVVNQGGEIVFLNLQAEKQFGYHRDELVGQKVTNIIPEGFAERLIADNLRSADDALAQHIGSGIELIGRRKDGSEFPIELMLSPLESSEGILVTAAIRNFSVRKAAEKHLAQMELRYRGLLEAAPDAMVVVNQGGEIVLLNLQAEKQFGYRRDELVGQKVTNIIPEGFAERLVADDLRTAEDALAQQIGTGIELIGRRKDGSEFPIELMLSPLESAEGILVTAAIRDITQRKLAERRLYQAQKMEAVGQLTGGIAHDFNNLLTVILGNAEILTKALTGDPQLGPVATLVGSAAQRGADLTKSLLAFSRKLVLQPTVTDVNQLVSRMDELLSRTLGEHIDIDFVPRTGLWPTIVDPPQLETAILNLAVNARDAMPQGGKLTIEMANVELDWEFSKHNEGARVGFYVMISVADTGTGMTGEVLARAFEPFFTTKEVGKGTGIGLSMVYGFIKQSDGYIKIHSEAGRGTNVKLYLPRSEQPHRPSIAQGVRTEAVGGGETILIVEDDEMVHTFVTRQMKSLGYQVLSAHNGREALVILRQDTPIDLLFTDVVMPNGMDGPQLVAEARRLRPDLKVLYTSGYTENSVVRQRRLDPGVELLSKPYLRHDLAAKLRQVLDQAPGPR